MRSFSAATVSGQVRYWPGRIMVRTHNKDRFLRKLMQNVRPHFKIGRGDIYLYRIDGLLWIWCYTHKTLEKAVFA